MKMIKSENPPILNGVVLVASGAIGAGMFSLPIVSAGMWFGWTVVCLVLVWLVNYLATLLLLESNLLYRTGASFDTLVGDSLGRGWNSVNNLAIAFVMYILLYAYFSAGGSIVAQTLNSLTEAHSPIPQNVSGMFFGLIIALLVWSGAAAVSRICSILLAAMVVTFLLSTSGLLLHIEISNLLAQSDLKSPLFPYVWAALPYFVTAFACSGLVPSLVKYYGHEPAKIRLCLLYGTLVSLVIYLLWVTAVFGSVSRSEIAPVIAAGGNMGQLVSLLQEGSGDRSMHLVLNLFSNFAITTSFLSIGLGLFDYLADRFHMGDGKHGRTKTALLTFLPPAILSFMFPDGFILAIGYAGLVVLFSFFVVPVAMSLKNRSRRQPLIYQLGGGKPLLIGVLLFSLLVAVFKIMGSLEMLPTYP